MTQHPPEARPEPRPEPRTPPMRPAPGPALPPPPPSRLLPIALLLLAAALLPFFAAGSHAFALGSRIAVFALLAGSYDLVLGYTGIVSFAHAAFFGFGAYGVAIALNGEASFPALLLGALGGIGVAGGFAFLLTLLSLRVETLFFAMLTLAFGRLAQIVAEEWREVTGGTDGLTFRLPAPLGPADRLWGVDLLSGRHLTLLLLAGVAIGAFFLLDRLVRSPLGSVLAAIRDNPRRARALGYSPLLFRSLASVIAAMAAALAGAMQAVALRYVNPDVALSFALMIDVLLMGVIGGLGTLIGPVIGAIVLVFMEDGLEPLLAWLAPLMAAVPGAGALFSPERWLFWLGAAFVLIVYLAPEGLSGLARRRGGAG
jgi:branched-chain amino acid transport system permease protein